jgi:hypothetical protein
VKQDLEAHRQVRFFLPAFYNVPVVTGDEIVTKS